MDSTLIFKILKGHPLSNKRVKIDIKKEEKMDYAIFSFEREVRFASHDL
jgi:hypothetical protein